MLPRYLQYLLTDFRQTFLTGATRDRDELIRFWGQKVTVQGHGMTECIPDFHVSTISPVSIDRFSPNVCHWCILGHRWPDYIFGSKGQSSRSHHRGGGAQHSTLPLSATFSSLLIVICAMLMLLSAVWVRVFVVQLYYSLMFETLLQSLVEIPEQHWRPFDLYCHITLWSVAVNKSTANCCCFFVT